MVLIFFLKLVHSYSIKSMAKENCFLVSLHCECCYSLLSCVGKVQALAIVQRNHHCSCTENSYADAFSPASSTS